MAIEGLSNQTIPFHIARVYGLSPVRAVESAALVGPAQGATAGGAEPAGRIGSSQPRLVAEETRSPGIDRLVGALVPGGVDFRADVPVRREALPFYARPGDANAAATAIRIGRGLDVEG